MKFGVREICDVVFKAKQSGNLGSYSYVTGQPVLYIDSAKTSTIEGAATTVYAQGGKGNSRLLAWEGEKTLTFTVADALLSPVGFAILSGAGLLNASTDDKIKVHCTANARLSVKDKTATINLSETLKDGESIDSTAPVFVIKMDKHGSFEGMLDGFTAAETSLTKANVDYQDCDVFVDFYMEKTAGVSELTIDAGNFAGYYYVEGSTLFRRQSDGKDLPAEITFPKVKIQSNFTFNMASTGDPSTFTFTMDAFPGRIHNSTKEVLCAIQIVDDEAADDAQDEGDSIERN